MFWSVNRKPINPLKKARINNILKTQFQPPKGLNASAIKNTFVSALEGAMAVHSENRTKPVSTLSRCKAELLTAKAGGASSYRLAIKC
jgi:hypothetical protein